MYNSILSFYLNKIYEPDIQYNGNVKYSFKNLKDGYTGNNFLELDVYLNEKKSSAKIQLLNIFKDNHILPYSGPATVDYDEWEISDVLWKNFYYGNDKYMPELKEFFKMYQYQLNISIFCTTRALTFSWLRLNHRN